MTAPVFVDTNVLIYAVDRGDLKKQQAARAWRSELWKSHRGRISFQVLQEFYVNVTRKIASPLPRDVARLAVNSYSIWCIETSPAEISLAFRIEDESKVGFWDALIVASAVKCGATRILSEDLNAQQVIAGVRLENPFANIA